MFRHLVIVGIASCLLHPATANDGLLSDDDVSTARGDVSEARGEFAEGLGKVSFLRSMSAQQLQEAIDDEARFDINDNRVDF